MDWKKYVREHYIRGKYGTPRLSKETGIDRDKIKYFIHSEGLDKIKSDHTTSEVYKLAHELNDPTQAIVSMIKKGSSIENMSSQIVLSERVILAHISDLIDQGYCILENNGFYTIQKSIDSTIVNVINKNWSGDKIIRLSVVSDPHIGSKYSQYTYLGQLYDTFKREGIQHSVCSGDMTEGYKMRPGHEYEVHAHGADEQVNWVAKIWPKNGITTDFIIGNHDQSHIKNGGVDVGKRIAAARPDMNYMGMLNAKINITPNCTIELNHPLDGASYALSYALQKSIDSMSGGDKPNIMFNGHHHKLFYMIYRNIHAFEVGTTQLQTPWMKGKRIAANMGGIILEVHVDDEGTITRCKPEFIPFYKSIQDDYLNWQ